MDGELRDDIPCSSLAVDSFLRLGASFQVVICFLGVACFSFAEFMLFNWVTSRDLWQEVLGGFLLVLMKLGKELSLLDSGLIGLARAALLAKSVGKYGVQCGLFAGVLSATNCRIQRYRMKKDWVNASVAGAITGALLAAKTRSWMQVLSTSAVVSGIAAAADHWRKI